MHFHFPNIFYFLISFIFSHLLLLQVQAIDLCPSGSFILGRGLSPENVQDAVNEHNRYRKMLVDGEVPGQPRANYMKTITYDDKLAKKCVPISSQCMMNHLEVTDKRWKCIGQNIYIACHSQFSLTQNWTAALASWFWECNDFAYPNIPTNGKDVGHYTQVAWADTDTIGCDFILFIEPKKPWVPFCKMYTCNYAPCGNYNDLPPYENADNPCDPSKPKIIPKYTLRIPDSECSSESGAG